MPSTLKSMTQLIPTWQIHHRRLNLLLTPHFRLEGTHLCFAIYMLKVSFKRLTKQVIFYWTYIVKRPVVLGISETWLDASVPDGAVAIDGYTIYKRDWTTRGGGIIIYTPNTIQSWRRHDLEDTQVEAIWSEIIIKRKRRTILLCNIYRPPNTAISFLDDVGYLMERALKEGNAIILMGDLNCNLMKH